jgi:hypothetical protein
MRAEERTFRVLYLEPRPSEWRQSLAVWFLRIGFRLLRVEAPDTVRGQRIAPTAPTRPEGTADA